MPTRYIITGAGGNMGRAIVSKFLAEGLYVTGTFSPHDNIAAAFDKPNFEPAVVDLKNEKASETFVADIIHKYKQIDAAVLTVGGFVTGNIKATGSADILNQYQLNFETTYHIARPVFNQMLKQGYGRIFLTGSRPGLNAAGSANMIAYSLAKSLIFRLAELLNEETKGKNIVTSVLVPSTIDTPQNRKAMPDADFNDWIKPEAIADAVYFYCTKEAGALREPIIKLYNNS